MTDPGPRHIARLTPTRWTFRYARLVKLRWLMATGPLVALVGAASSYGVRGPTLPSIQPVITLLEGLPLPLWPLLFGGTAALMVVALTVLRALAGVHFLAAGVLAFHAFATGFGALITSSTGWVTASLSAGMALNCIFHGLVYAKGR